LAAGSGAVEEEVGEAEAGPALISDAAEGIEDVYDMWSMDVSDTRL